MTTNRGAIRQGSIWTFDEQNSGFTQSFRKKAKEGRFGVHVAKDVPTDAFFVVLSQCCDNANSKEKYYELAQLKRKETQLPLSEPQRRKSLGRDYKSLLLNINGDWYEVSEELITKVAKKDFEVGSKKLIQKGTLDENTKRILIDWRIRRYAREPFPDAFNSEFKNFINNDNTANLFIEYLRVNRDDIHSVRLFVTPDDDENASSYTAVISVVLTKAGESRKDEFSDRIFEFIEAFDTFSEIVSCAPQLRQSSQHDLPEELNSALTHSYDDFTFSDAYHLREFNFQYLCYTDT